MLSREYRPGPPLRPRHRALGGVRGVDHQAVLGAACTEAVDDALQPLWRGAAERDAIRMAQVSHPPRCARRADLHPHPRAGRTQALVQVPDVPCAYANVARVRCSKPAAWPRAVRNLIALASCLPHTQGGLPRSLPDCVLAPPGDAYWVLHAAAVAVGAAGAVDGYLAVQMPDACAACVGPPSGDWWCAGGPRALCHRAHGRSDGLPGVPHAPSMG